MSSPFPHLIWSKGHTRYAKPPSKVVKAASLLIHSPLLSIHFHHTQSSFLAPQTFIFHSTSFSHRSSILFVAFLSISQFSYRILLFSSPIRPPPCVQTTSTHCSARPATSLVTPALLHTSSFLTQSILCVTPHTIRTPYSSSISSSLHLISSYDNDQ